MNPLPLEGWVPIRLIWQGPEPVVEWCHLGRARFTHPFFDGTIQPALETPFNRLFRHHTTMAALADWAARSPGIPPSGFVLHMSRCGSTVISQMLAALPGNVVISEAGPLDAIARAYLRTPSATLAQRVEWLRCMVSALGQPRSGEESRYFIKFDARTTLELPLLRQAFPRVPWVFVYRDPVEVLVSLENSPNAMTTPGMGENLAGMLAPPEEYAARVLGRLCDAAIAHFPAGGGLLVNYNQIPDIVCRALPAHFGIDWDSASIARMKEASLQHAKHPGRRFASDSARRQAEASPAIRLAAQLWAAPQYQKLENLRAQGRS